ncbi:MAG: hypothetical protein NTZ39_05970 [Methanoregula sp.]|nr:hypothetical protein [Methanoregula sp.]
MLTEESNTRNAGQPLDSAPARALCDTLRSNSFGGTSLLKYYEMYYEIIFPLE